MQVDKYEFLNAMSIANLDDDDVRGDYSGRAMYGRTCVGVVVESVGQLIEVGAALQDQFGSVEDYTNVHTDNMGMGMIIYWPSLTFTETEAS